MTPLATEPDQVDWRLDEHRIEGDWFGGEFPRLWPPRCGCGCMPARWSPCVLPCCEAAAMSDPDPRARARAEPTVSPGEQP